MAAYLHWGPVSLRAEDIVSFHLDCPFYLPPFIGKEPLAVSGGGTGSTDATRFEFKTTPLRGKYLKFEAVDE